ncbi:MAG: gliding motility-associated C-terminal domain-containing protein [Weeksellaceae bacterium]|nr:gliding motility-associated C-terminal domain-containing protein [Bacteroidota bacterium]MCG2780404.1 gliding motility-associated C-terminal domain-containing protein [Weeksellaceae bacterium]
MRKIYFLLFIFFFISGFSQTVNLYNPITNVSYPAQQYFCAGNSFNLKVDAAATSTGDYAMTKDLPSNYPLSAGSIPINFPATGANKFSESFPIGFTFSFYGKNYTKAVMGSNGRLVFTNDPELDNLKDTNTYTDRTYSGITGYNTYSVLPSTDYNKVFKNNPTQELNLAQIFFGYTDLIPRSQNSSVTYLYKNIIFGGVNGLLVSFQNQIRTNGTGGISSTTYYSNIILLEDGRIIIYVNNKTEDSYNAILGIQNDDASKFKVPVHSNTTNNYNNGKWKSEGVAWVFTPNQNLTPQFKWYRNGTPITGATADTLSGFSPNDGDILKVEVTYHDPSGVQIGAAVSDQIIFSALPVPAVSIKSAACSQSVLETPLLPGMSYEWFQVGNPAVISTTNQAAVSVTGSYFVRMRHTSNAACFNDSAPISVNFTNSFPPFNNSPKYICKTDGSTSTTVNLYDYYPANPSQYSVVFEENGVNIPNYTSFPIAANTTRTITVRAQNTAGTCTFTDSFDMVFASLPVNGTVYSPDKTCTVLTSYKAADFKTKFTPSLNVNILFSTDGINYNLTEVNPSLNNPVYVKIKHPNFACETTGTVSFTTYPQVTANTPNPNNPDLVQCASSTQTYNLHALFDNEVNPGSVTVTYHTTPAGAQAGDNSVPNSTAFRSGLGNTVLYIRVVDNTTGCVAQNFPAVTLVVYPKPRVVSPNPIILKNCVGNSLFNLTQTVSSLTNAQPPVVPSIQYYSQNGTLLTPGQVTNYDSSVLGTKPYIKIIYNSTCDDVVNFDLQFNPKPASQISQILICNEVTYSLQNFQNAVITNSTQYTFSDVSGNPLPADFDVSVLPKTVQFLMKDKSTGCVSDVETVTFTKGTGSVLLTNETDYPLCDSDFDGKNAFDLNSKKAVFTNDPAAVFEYFKDQTLTQIIPAVYTNETAFAQTVYLKIMLPGFCPALAKINLKVNTPTKSSTLLDKYFICYGETLNIDAGPENVSRKWSTGETSPTVNISKAGSYSVELTNAAGCTYTHQFMVSDENQPKIEVVNQTNNSIEVIASGGVKPYKYYFNGIAQNSNVLMNPTAASYIIQVESATGCFGEPKTIYFIKINNAFTPNSDGINDFWSIENLDKMENISVVIVDRYGNKVFETQDKNKVSWDGTSGGHSLSTASYWYTASWFDPVTKKNEQRQGWIMLKNRN